MSKTVEDIGTLKINLLSQAQYDAEKAGGRLADDELYLTPSSGTGVSDVEVNGSSVVSGGVAEIELKTINQNSIVGSGDIEIQGGASAFVAEYGVTTYADIKDAYDEDAIILCTVDDSGNTKICQLAYYDDENGIFYFAQPQSDGFYLPSIASDDTWDDGYFMFASTETATQLRDGLMSALDWQKLDGIASGAEVNVQSDWNEADNTKDDFIKNKPTIPSKTSDLNNDSGFITSSSLPTDLSDLNNDMNVSDFPNDAGYITGYTETDPTVPSWAKQVSKPSYTASEVGALPDTTPIPSKTSDLTNDSGFITGVTSTSTPTASTIAEFDSSSCMNSTDMTTGSGSEVEDFIAGLNTSVGDYVKWSEIGDFIVEQGTSGIWTYRKWNSGIAECWGRENKASATLNANSYLNFNVSLPSFFVNEVPIATGSGGATGHVRTFLAYTNVGGSSGAYSIDSYILSTDSSSATGVWAFYNVKGRWK